LDMHEIDDLREHIVGEWEGLPWEEVMPNIKANIRPPGGENKDDYSLRVRTTLTGILETNDDPVMIVAHGGTFYSLLHLYERRYEGSINNCHLHYFEPYASNDAFPWRIWQFDVGEKALSRSCAPFCATMDLAKTA
ncbi:histidine phosphatase family protein, partial [Hoeflea sp.]|uniref:histidine phosphatase family protein n=1 Tax=Hoeflea sp. TaxID=1940281 RepID=UPI00199A22F4